MIPHPACRALVVAALALTGLTGCASVGTTPPASPSIGLSSAISQASAVQSTKPRPKARRRRHAARHKPASPRPAPSSQAPAPPPQPTGPGGCYPVSDEGGCYEPGEFCRDSDHGVTGLAGDGKTITCTDNDGWRWEPS